MHVKTVELVVFGFIAAFVLLRVLWQRRDRQSDVESDGHTRAAERERNWSPRNAWAPILRRRSQVVQVPDLTCQILLSAK
jgi:hypothetical protein